MRLKDDLRQRHIEDWEREFHARREPAERGASRYYGAVVRAAIAAGWFDDPIEEEAVGDMRGGEVKKLAEKIDAAYTDAVTLDPN